MMDRNNLSSISIARFIDVFMEEWLSAGSRIIRRQTEPDCAPPCCTSGCLRGRWSARDVRWSFGAFDRGNARHEEVGL